MTKRVKMATALMSSSAAYSLVVLAAPQDVASDLGIGYVAFFFATYGASAWAGRK